MKGWFAAGCFLAVAGCAPEHAPVAARPSVNFAKEKAMEKRVEEILDPGKLTEEDWRRILTPEQFEVCRRGGTEAAWSGEYNEFFGEGVYRCVCCGAKLFDSGTKYRSRCGWPSFWAPLEGSVKFDELGGRHGSEVICARCDAHLGHVFDDGPPPTGKRY